MSASLVLRSAAGAALALACAATAAAAPPASAHLTGATAEPPPAKHGVTARHARGDACDVSFRFAAREEGHELALTDVHVVFDDAATLVRVLSAVSDGPFLVASVPQGRYRVTATHEGRAQVVELHVAPGARARLTFYW